MRRRMGMESYGLGDRYITPDRRLSKMLLEGNTRKGKPAYHWSDTLGRIAQQLAGGYLAGRDRNNQDVANKAFTGVEPTTYRPPTEAEAYEKSPDLQASHFAANTQTNSPLAEMIPEGLGHLSSPSNLERNAPTISDDEFMAGRNKPRPDGIENDFFENGALAETTDFKDNRRVGNTEFHEDGSTKKIVTYDPNGKELSTEEFEQGKIFAPLSDRVRASLKEDSPSTGVGPRDYAQELAQGMRAYQGNEDNRITKQKMPQSEYSMQNLRELTDNPYAQRLLQGLMMQSADRDYASGLAETQRKNKVDDATTAYNRSQQPLSAEQFEQQKQLKELGRVTYQPVVIDGKTMQQSSRGKVSSMPMPPTSKGVQALDRKFGKFYADHYAQGGVHDALNNVSKLEGVISQLDAIADGTDKVNNLTGPVIGLRPKFMDAMVNPQQVAAQDAVEEVVQRNLRVVLGAAFTAKEGEALIARAYNPKLEEAENAIRVQRLLNAMRSTLQAQLKAGQYFEKNGTLQGWEGSRTTLSIADLENIIDGSDMLKTGEFGNVTSPSVRTDRTRKTDGLSPDKKQRLEELRRKARGE